MSLENLLFPLLKKWFPQETINDFQKGLSVLREYKKTHNVNSAQSALQALIDLNVPKDFLSKTGGLVNNPVVSSIAQTCNVDVGKIQKDVEMMMGGQSTTSSVDLLSSLKNDLNKLK